MGKSASDETMSRGVPTFLKYVLDGTPKRRLLWSLTGGVAVKTVFTATLTYTQPCNTHKLECSDGTIILIMDVTAIFAAHIILFSVMAHRFWYTSVHRGLILNQPDHWTAAASRDVFLECSAAMRAQHDVAKMTILISSVIVAVAKGFQIAYDETASQAIASREEILAYLNSACGSTYSGCHVAWTTLRPLTILMAGTCLTLICIYLTTPLAAWSQTVQEAARQTDDVYIRRLLVFPWVLMSLLMSSSALLAFQFTMHMKMAATQMVVMACLMAFQVALQLIAVTWATGGFLQLADAVRSVLGAVPPTFRRFTRRWRATQPMEMNVKWLGTRTLFHSRETGLRQQQPVLLFTLILLWSFSAVTPSGWYNAMIWTLRGVCLLALVVLRDEEAGFGDLGRFPAFGLVVDKRDLCKAIECNLKGEDFTGNVRRYKGSIFRMHETVSPASALSCWPASQPSCICPDGAVCPSARQLTLFLPVSFQVAVSYRWQSEEVELSETCSVNMSKWQLRELLHFLRSTNALYVWIDHLSVPQEHETLLITTQRLLLSRMMAVYSSAAFTLVLRSCEPEASRYHQRGECRAAASRSAFLDSSHSCMLGS